MILSSTETMVDAFYLRVLDDSPKTLDLIADFLEIYNLEAEKSEFYDSDVHKVYANVLNSIQEESIDVRNDIEVRALLNKLQSRQELKDNRSLFETIEKALVEQKTVTEERIDVLRRKVLNAVTWSKQDAHIRKMFSLSRKCIKTESSSMQRDILEDIIEEAKQLTECRAQFTTNKGAIEHINLSDKDSIQHALDNNKQFNGDKYLQVGLQGLERIFGENKGPTPGEMVCFAALSHNFKSGMLMSMARWLCKYNKAVPVDGRQPVILFISLENAAHKNLMSWFRTSYELAYKRSPGNLSDSEIIEFVQEQYAQNGYELHVYRKDGATFGFKEYCALIDEFNSTGKFVDTVIIDYLACMLGEYRKDERNDLRLQKLYTDVRAKAQKDLHRIITAHQLNSGAAMLTSGGTSNPIKQFGAPHLADASAIFRELDCLIFLHIEYNNQGIPFLTMQWGKHRHVENTPQRDKYCAYRFGQFGIEDDINGKCAAVRDIYAYKSSKKERESLMGDTPSVSTTF